MGEGAHWSSVMCQICSYTRHEQGLLRGEGLCTYIQTTSGTSNLSCMYDTDTGPFRQSILILPVFPTAYHRKDCEMATASIGTHSEWPPSASAIVCTACTRRPA